MAVKKFKTLLKIRIKTGHNLKKYIHIGTKAKSWVHENEWNPKYCLFNFKPV